jgi:hypothetical protein
MSRRVTLDDFNDIPVDSAESDQPKEVDWAAIRANGIPEPEWLVEPYIAARSRVWAWGPTESGKSIWAAWIATGLTRRGLHVAYFSQENPWQVDASRILRLHPDFAFLHFFHHKDFQFDLARGDDCDTITNLAAGMSLVVFDTLTACWSGDEGDNRQIVSLDREVFLPLINETGTTVLVIDHTGHVQQFVKRSGASAGRGASSKGQKADAVLEFRAAGESQFLIHHGKNRIGGGKREPDRAYRVEDLGDDELELIEVPIAADEKVQALADELVEVVFEADGLTTTQVREAGVKLGAGTTLVSAAMKLLEAQDPPRVAIAWEERQKEKGGRQRAKVWRGAGNESASFDSLFGDGALDEP